MSSAGGQTMDMALIRRVAEGRDQQAFSTLYDRHAPAVFGLACRILGGREEAEDLLQEVFLSLWEKASSHDPSRAPVAAWIMVMTRSRCLDRLRRRALRQGRERTIHGEGDDGGILATLAEPGAPVLEDLASAERRTEVRRCLAALPEPQCAALEAAFFKGLTQQEIAASSGEPLGTIKTRMRLGLMKLAEALSTLEKQI